MIRIVYAVGALVLVSGLNAQLAATAEQAGAGGTAVVAQRKATPATGAKTLPVNTELLLTLDREVNSKQVKQGDTFPLSVTTDVMMGDYIVIPKGTPAVGEVTYRTGKGAFGKSAKMDIDLRSIDLNGHRVPITGHFREEGAGNTGATVGTAVAAGPFAAFVTGRSAVFKQGREFRAQTREAIPVVFAD